MWLKKIGTPVRKLIRFKKALRVSDSKGAMKMICEYLIYRFSNSGLSEQYFNKFLFRESATNPSDYINSRCLYRRILQVLCYQLIGH
jgi:hypothetical protein